MTHTMRDWLETYKPQASRRTQLLMASLLWSVVGGILLTAGVRWVLQSEHNRRWWLIVAALLLGALKSRWALDRAAGRITSRILQRGDGKCLGGFLSIWTWLFVVLMAGLGAVLRRVPVPRLVVGLLYAAVGFALFWSARRLWRAWREQ